MKNIFLKFLIFISLLGFVCCKEKENGVKINYLAREIKQKLGDTLKVPDSLELYNPLKLSPEEIEKQASELKIYSHIDASCGTCVESIKAWNNLIPILKKKNVQVNLLCSSNNKFELLKYYFETNEIKDFSHYLFLDHKNEYLEKNRFMLESKNFETVLVDKNNEILLIGNPIFTKEIRDLYFKEIEKHLERL